MFGTLGKETPRMNYLSAILEDQVKYNLVVWLVTLLYQHLGLLYFSIIKILAFVIKSSTLEKSVILFFNCLKLYDQIIYNFVLMVYSLL